MRARKEWVIGSSFEEFFARAERPIRYALCARYGFETGREAAAEALAYAWENWDRLSGMSNPTGYAYRVGQRLAARMARRRDTAAPMAPEEGTPHYEPGLQPALLRLPLRQRQAVVLVHGLGMTQVEAGSILGVSASSIQRHLERALAKLRVDLGIEHET